MTDTLRDEFEAEVRRLIGTGLLAMGKKDNGEYYSERLNAFFKFYLVGRAAADEDTKLLDSGCIMTYERDEFGEHMCERRGLNLRAAIRDAMQKEQGR